MSTELKDTIEAIGKAFEEFKAENDKKLKELSTSKDDPILTEKIDKINAEMTDLKNLKFEIENLEKVVGRIGAPEGGGATSNGVKAAHKAAFEKYFRKGGEAALEAVKELQVQAGFIVGFDSDPPSIFERQIRFIQESGIATAMVGMLTALKGTKLYYRLVREGRLLEDASGDNTSIATNFIPAMNMRAGPQKVCMIPL